MSYAVGSVVSPSSQKGRDIHVSKLHKLIHPKKSTLKRHLHDLEVEQTDHGKVCVQSVQSGSHLTKKLKSDWDLLFYNGSHDGEAFDFGDRSISYKHFIDETCAKSPTTSAIEQYSPPKVKKRQSFLVRGKEMKSFFRLLGKFALVVYYNVASVVQGSGRASDLVSKSPLFATRSGHALLGIG